MLYSIILLFMTVLAISFFIVSAMHAGLAIFSSKKSRKRKYHKRHSRIMLHIGLALTAAAVLFNILFG